MDSYQVSGASAPGKPSILSRDLDGNEHLLNVADHPAGMISISDGEVVRVLSPSATAALVMELIHAMGSHPRGATRRNFGCMRRPTCAPGCKGGMLQELNELRAVPAKRALEA
jgi:hypothetical protein